MAAVPQSRTDLVAEAVQEQVQAAERRLDLLGVLLWQPAESSAAGAPGKVSALQEQKQLSSPKRRPKTVGLTVWRMRM